MDWLFCFQMSSPKPTVMTSPVVAEKHSPTPASDVPKPPTKSPSPAPTATASETAAEPVDTETTSGSKLEDLETELELDLENMKLDNIDTAVC